ncbi:hypothetical protein [Methylobacterium sp. GXF4]|uniref:Cap15 family cyclic dinucleotide receptor domain-containing protein n=1 Tax=Methylobacterium sp. GXF4 TaxID=1096546 RepID=UPI000FFE9B35|nr:hypothetical protein [Methylobacterium sp. GXF4]
MISILPVLRIIITIAGLYAAASIAAVLYGMDYGNFSDVVSKAKIAFAGTTGLGLLLTFIVIVAWRWIWWLVPPLNRWIFPDLNGAWDMEIHWHNAEGKSGKVAALAHIKQTILTISMEVTSPGSESETLIAQAQKDKNSGRAQLYYVFNVFPNNTNPGSGPPYQGAAILKLSNSASDEISGNYWTSAKTSGHYFLRKQRS